MKFLTVLVLFFGLSVVAMAEDYQWAPEQPVGSQLPSFTLPDANGNPKEISSLLGTKGMLLLFSRSSEW
ncbi:MAG: hypothetical protein ACI8Z1_003109 [Candidatus Azotimanducaceae bacterium]|jgi:hypothetical protein